MLEAVDIERVYRQAKNDLHVLKGVNLNLKKGDFIAIVGPSGAGKSTFLHILGGLDVPNGGSVFFKGKDIYRLNDRARSSFRNQEIGFVFQFYHLLAEFNVLENVLMPAYVSRVQKRGKKLDALGKEALEKVGLSARLTHKPYQLSGGEQQRVAIARALINEPTVLLCDEPTGNLDSQSGQGIINSLVKLNEEKQQTIVVVTHDESIARRAHRIVHMKDGVLI